ncbi:TSPO [Lepeophtheirus salmonis]|uniref:TSPO n=1 Tax=Lepeophtheirus salmonis TaxID=72036 RepID=A0A7R8CQT3_LEPSM|nr:TSPO [Lepeophtheirus salmonis]CAF2898811.1 TSPO [Lepeophtheirus salmonis]
MINWTKIGAIGLPFIGAAYGNIVTKKHIKSGWYESLKFPSFRPPNWVFWTSGKSLNGPAKVPLILYGTQLLLNWIWTPLFFGAHKLRLAFYECLLLVGAVGATTVSFFQMNTMAGGLFVPYLLWSSFASYLNYSIMKLNEKKD